MSLVSSLTMDLYLWDGTLAYISIFYLHIFIPQIFLYAIHPREILHPDAPDNLTALQGGP